MRASIVALGLLVVSTMADKLAFQNISFGVMLKRGDMILKRQGYTPETETCGRAETCEEACGANSVECSSTDTSTLYCHLSNDGSKCCPDDSGNSCEAGYYCTSDSAGDTYCCPDGSDTASCAQQYSLSVSLIRQTATPIPSAIPLGSTVSVETPVSTSALHVSIAGSTSARTIAASTTSRTDTAATSAPSHSNGGARKTMGAGAAVLAGALGFAGLL
ncbi:uncharacterized protein M421DRAFT_420641 [Didymella exigua CBS 183.55]|uniref:Uncharacterized protein n=1 Tax=Didymella exigua CBS 183.55 TaxID=1150837 RepID=A0A6A5RLS8_9PLEO|nr:uncharacterized protein M421DRAFT_420641 [Didymella exigua CBS 183.55]KAF1928742.1 hypothetical protein M421DRAFT_420641 [Didymella exigua CBS 183.55]